MFILPENVCDTITECLMVGLSANLIYHTIIWEAVMYFSRHYYSKNHKTDFILEETAMPDELVRNVRGVEIFNQSLPQVN